MGHKKRQQSTARLLARRRGCGCGRYVRVEAPSFFCRASGTGAPGRRYYHWRLGRFSRRDVAFSACRHGGPGGLPSQGNNGGSSFDHVVGHHVDGGRALRSTRPPGE